MKLLLIISSLLLTACADLAYFHREDDTVIRVKTDSPCTEVKNSDLHVNYNCN